MNYPIAPNGIFATIQGEGHLLGVPMVFVRLAGCSIGCHECDTDYRVAERLTAQQIGERVLAIRPVCKWTWITGGEPADHELWPLVEALRLCGRVALATSGHKRLGFAPVNFLSVSPHGKPTDLQVHRCDQLNLVPGLNGLKLIDWADYDPHPLTFASSAYVTPCDGKPETVAECVEFVRRNSRWRLGVQAHKLWGIP